MPKNQANRANHAEQDDFLLLGGTNEESLTAAAERLEWLRPASDEVLGSAIVRAGSCMDEFVDGDRPGWLFDETTDHGSAALVCMGCPVRDECLELELRLFGAQKLGMWGALGEDGRRALHPVWSRMRGNVADSHDAGRGGDR
jgi:WhiB family transcriptional regulator, redox-sensing transcriptional regulator